MPRRNSSRWSPLLMGCVLVLIFGLFAVAVQAYTDRLDTAFRRVDRAVQESVFSEKEGVLLQARILFDPSGLPENSPYRPGAGEKRPPRLYVRELLADLERLRDQFSTEERQVLAGLNPEASPRLAQREDDRETSAFPVRLQGATPYARVTEAQRRGTIGRKEALLAKAALLFAPASLPPGSPFRPADSEEPGAERCLTSFYKEVDRVFPELTPQERDFLRGLEPSLALILETLERKGSGLPPRRDLPNYPDLDKKVVGEECIVHYTDSPESRNMILNADFPVTVLTAMDQAIATMPPHFRKAYTDGGPKMHVYVVRMPQGTFGSTVSAGVVGGDPKKRKVYIKITPGLFTRGGADWVSFVRGTVFHEYHHGIQGAYNWNMSDWVCECLSEWASCYYGKWWWSPADAYRYAASIFNRPEWPLWYTSGNREYSTSPLAFSLGHRYGGYRFIRSWMEFMEVNGDAIRALNSVLSADHATSFREEYLNYLAALYTRAIPSIRNIMPPVNKIELANFGTDPKEGAVYQTGARYYLLKPQVGAEGTTLVAQFTPKAGWKAKLEAFLIKNGKMTLYPIRTDVWNGFVKQFGPLVKEVVMVATDARYVAADATVRGYDYAFSVPYGHIEGVEPEYGPVVEGQTFNIYVPMELSGVYPTQDYPATVEYWLEAGENVRIHEVVETQLPPPPAGMSFEVQTAAGYAGKGRFVVQVRLPSDTWNVPQVKTAGECALEIVPAAGVDAGLPDLGIPAQSGP